MIFGNLTVCTAKSFIHLWLRKSATLGMVIAHVGRLDFVNKAYELSLTTKLDVN